MKRNSAEHRLIGFDPRLYEPWVPRASGVGRSSETIPIFVRRSEDAIKKADASLFLDRLALAYLELAEVLAESNDEETPSRGQSNSTGTFG